VKGAEYHARFAAVPGRALMWELERDVLRRCIASTNPHYVLDFATGTGRIACTLKRSAPSAEVHGIDVSPSMLDVARGSAPGVELHLLDGRQAVAHFGINRFDFVSAFRFFANADQKLRADAAEQIAALLRPGGWLLFNNHRNFWSTSYVVRRLFNRGKPEGALNSELTELFLGRGFRLVRRYSLGVWPQSERLSYGLPWSVTGWIERANLSATAALHEAGYNTIWLLQRTARPTNVR
jgi:SAM-dependent methyltransferase